MSVAGKDMVPEQEGQGAQTAEEKRGASAQGEDAATRHVVNISELTADSNCAAYQWTPQIQLKNELASSTNFTLWCF